MTILDGLDSVIDCFAVPGGLDVERRSAAGYDADGDATGGPLQRFHLEPAVFQPAPAKELLRLAEGDRGKATWLLHSKRKLRVSVESTGLAADVVEYCPPGEEKQRYTVKVAGDWSVIGGFYSCLCQREEQG